MIDLQLNPSHTPQPGYMAGQVGGDRSAHVAGAQPEGSAPAWQ